MLKTGRNWLRQRLPASKLNKSNSVRLKEPEPTKRQANGRRWQSNRSKLSRRTQSKKTAQLLSVPRSRRHVSSRKRHNVRKKPSVLLKSKRDVSKKRLVASLRIRHGVSRRKHVVRLRNRRGVSRKSKRGVSRRKQVVRLRNRRGVSRKNRHGVSRRKHVVRLRSKRGVSRKKHVVQLKSVPGNSRSSQGASRRNRRDVNRTRLEGPQDSVAGRRLRKECARLKRGCGSKGKRGGGVDAVA
jgi:hypothetical protein